MNVATRVARSVYNSVRHANYSTLPSEVVLFLDDKMIVCWHPEKKFPYECSLPLPEEKVDSNSVLKIGAKEYKDAFSKPQKPDVIAQELSKITYTTKHIWFPRSRDKKAKKTPPDRPYL